ncbi:MAG: hypothetical protein IKN04_08935 [Clostridia bacterium]|nr:hypothetical protein [Clostridia bacterium]
MKYCARYNTADPRIGFVSVGEILTDEQARMLGKDKIAELVNDGVLYAVRETTEAETEASSQEEPLEDGGELEQAESSPDETDAGEDDSDGEADEDAEIPEPDDMSDIVPEDKADEPEKHAENKRGRRKTK